MKLWIILPLIAIAIIGMIAWPGGDIERRECLRGYHTNTITGEVRLYKFMKDYDNHVVTCFYKQADDTWKEDQDRTIGLFYVVKYGEKGAVKEACRRLGF